jgi:surface carbohydrate biosynthesis protein
MQITDNIPTVVLPVDLPVRELTSKLILASALAAAGCRAVVGNKKEIISIARQSGPLVWLGKELFADDETSVKNLYGSEILRNGSAIVSMQEEGGMFQGKSWKEQLIAKHQIDALRTRDVSRLCAWGERQLAVISAYAPEMIDTLQVTGSARFDISAPSYSWISQAATDKIRNQFGPYILVCTRFGAVTNAKGLHHPFWRKLEQSRHAKKSDRERVDNWFTKWQRDTHDFADFVTLTKELATANKNQRIILRPHPSEGLPFYLQAFSQFANITVVREGDVVSWIRGADLVVHSCCTTGIEAVLAGRPVVNFIPGESREADLDVEVAREAGLIATSIDKALDAIDALLKGEQHTRPWSSHARSMLSNLDREAVPLLVDTTVAVLQERRIESSKLSFPRKARQGLGIWSSFNRLTGRQLRKAHKPAKRRELDLRQVDTILAGTNSKRRSGRVREFTSHYVVIDPA